MKKIIYPAIFILFTGISGSFSADVPYLTGRITDNAQILSESSRKSLTGFLKEHELKTSNQIVILTISSLEGENIEDFANKVFNEWKLGQKDKDNGILIVIVPDERKMRIEVGYGLEGILPDITADRIIRNIMAPRFREGDFEGGITEGTKSIINILEGGEIEANSLIEETSEVSEPSFLGDLESTGLSLTERILMGAFIFGIIGLFTIIGILTPGFGWFMYLFLIPFWAMFPIVVLGTKGALICFIIYLIVFPAAKLFLKNSPWYKKAKTDLRTTGKASLGGFVFTSGGSGGSWSSGSSGSSFSGGGGSSGGGGASGSW